MNKLKQVVKSIVSKNPTEKIIIKTIVDVNPDVSTKTQLDVITNGLTSTKGSIEGYEIYELILKNVKSQKPRLAVLKTLFISHYALKIVGDSFVRHLLAEFHMNVLPPTKISHSDEYIYGILVANYYNFLVTYGNYFVDIQAYRDIDINLILKAFSDNDTTCVIQHLTYKNILKSFVKISNSFEGALRTLKNPSLVEKVILAIFEDLATIYNIITKTLRAVMSHIFEFSKDVAFLLDELYSEIISITRNLQSFIMNLDENLKHPLLSSFDFYTLDVEFNKKQELHMMQLKKSMKRENIEDKVVTEYMKEYQTFNVGKRNYQMNAEIWHITKPILLEKSSQLYIPDSNSPSPQKVIDGFVSPRMNPRRFEFQKAMSESPHHSKIKIDFNPQRTRENTYTSSINRWPSEVCYTERGEETYPEDKVLTTYPDNIQPKSFQSEVSESPYGLIPKDLLPMSPETKKPKSHSFRRRNMTIQQILPQQRLLHTENDYY